MDYSFDRLDIEPIELLLGVMVSITGLIHLYKGILSGSTQLLLAGLGFFGGLVLFGLFKDYRKLFSVAVIPYTSFQIYKYHQLYGLEFGTYGLIDKLVQICLVLLSIFYSFDRVMNSRHQNRRV